MNTTYITRGAFSDVGLLWQGVIYLCAVAIHVCWYVSEKRWLPAVTAIVFLVAAFFVFRKWLTYRSGTWRLQWQGTAIQILEKEQIKYEGELAGLYKIEADGRGYHLYIDPKTKYRLRIGRTSAEFEAALDQRTLVK